MYTRQDPSQQWTVHAQFTISHDGISDSNSGAPHTHTEKDENGVRMVYTWSSQPTPSNGADNNSQTDRSSASTENINSNSNNFQRGNMVFTSTPPIRRPTNLNDSNKLGVDSSGYSSELLSPNSFASTHFPGRPAQPYNRRCKSTCSIVLSTNFNEIRQDESDCQSQCGRTHSLRCQTPTLRCERKDAYYGCGDPWCYHSTYGDDTRFSPVPEADEYTSNNSKRPSRASTYTPHHYPDRSKSSPPKIEKSKDASVQTYEMIDKCTSPFMKMGLPEQKDKNVKNKKERPLKKRGAYTSRRKTEPLNRASLSPSITPDSLENKKITRRTVRSSAPLNVPSEVKNSNTSTSTDMNKKPRTVHIDVYCTGTEIDSDSSSSSNSGEKTISSPQTVYETGKVKITHKRASDDDLPYNLKSNLKIDDEKKCESDIEDGISTTYPSRSSFSGIGDFQSSFSSVPPSWSTMSMSSYVIPDDDSIANTSWKDTVSDFGSISRSSLTQTDSIDFVPRRLIQNSTKSSIDEQPELLQDLQKTSSSLQTSDSFEYANSEDMFRIKQMENIWSGNDKHWKCPQIQRKHLLQQQKIKEYFERREVEQVLKKTVSRDSESDSDASERGWTFIKNDEKNLERKDTVKRTLPLDIKPTERVAIKTESDFSQKPQVWCIDSRNKIGTACKSPSVLIIKEKMSKNPELRAPFTVLPGIYTEQRMIAKKFGKIVDVFKKPGHHIGPTKNPDCSCDHCRSYFETIGYRSRARSVDNYYNFKEADSNCQNFENKLSKKRENLSSSNLGSTNY